MRSELTKALETARRNKVIGHSLDAKVEIYAAGSELEQLKALGKEMASILIVSGITVKELDQAPADSFRAQGLQLAAIITAASGKKCERAGYTMKPLAATLSIAHYVFVAPVL